MKNRKEIALIISLIALISGCNNDDFSDLIEREERIFDTYLEKYDITTEPDEQGLYFIEEVAGTGLPVQDGFWTLVNYDLTVLDGENLIYSSDRETAVDNNIYDDRVIYGNSKLRIGNNIVGFDEGLKKMREGGKATLLFKSDLGYGGQSTGLIGAYQSLRIDVELVKVITDPVAWERKQIETYLDANFTEDIDTTQTGLYYIEIEEGTGDTSRNNLFVSINVDGFLIDGRKFMEEEAFRFQLGAYDYAITPGLNEGVSYMREGGKAKFIVPYYLAYGTVGKSYYEGKAKVPIPPYSTLVYDVELLTAK